MPFFRCCAKFPASARYRQECCRTLPSRDTIVWRCSCRSLLRFRVRMPCVVSVVSVTPVTILKTAGAAAGWRTSAAHLERAG